MLDAELLELAARVGVRLQQRRLLLATAESCTGGLVTYTNEAKAQMLGVPASALASFGAVSESVARAMAEGALVNSTAGCAVAVTGIAGPGGATADKPVGMVCFGWALRGLPTTVATVHFPGDRAAIRALSVRHALEGILIRLDSYPAGG